MKIYIKKAALCAAVVIVAVMLFRAISVTLPQSAAQSDTKEGLEYIGAQEKSEVSDIENEIRRARKDTQLLKKADEAKAQLAEGNFKGAFDGIIITGDSLVESIAEYGVLDNSQVIAQIGAGADFLSKKVGEIAAANPEFIVLHFGENELDKKPNAVYFFERYQNAIEKLKKRLPDAKILVDSIFPVKKKAYKQEPYTKNISYYNDIMKKTAEKLGVVYLDYSKKKDFFTSKYYDADGIHFTEDFYTEKYLPFVLGEVYK